MADILPELPGEFLDEFDAALRMGRYLIELCERLRVATLCAPGSVVQWGFDLDGVEFKLEMRVDQADG